MPEAWSGRVRIAALALACAAALAGAMQARADVHALADGNGGLVLSDRLGGGVPEWTVRDGAPVPAQQPAQEAAGATGPGVFPFHAEIESMAAAHKVDSRLVHAVVQVESAYLPGAVSRKGAAGLMQLMPMTAARYAVRDRFNPGQNLEGGIRYLADLIRMFPGDLGLALAAYNAGEGAVLRHGRRIPPYPETRAYVERVLARFAQLSRGTPTTRS